MLDAMLQVEDARAAEKRRLQKLAEQNLFEVDRALNVPDVTGGQAGQAAPAKAERGLSDEALDAVIRQLKKLKVDAKKFEQEKRRRAEERKSAGV